MRTRIMLLFLLALVLLMPAAVLAKKCTSVLPPEVFAFYGQRPGDVDCSDYEYWFLDLNDDGVNEIAVTNYRRSYDEAGYYSYEIFQRQNGKWTHIATIPGRPTRLDSVTNGYHDLSANMLGHNYVYGWDGQRYRDLAQMQTSDEVTRTTPTPAPTPRPVPKPTPTPNPNDGP
jgi:hypothetical protein